MQDLLCDFRMLPCHNMTFEQQMNALSRLSIVTAVIIGLFGYNNCALVFLLFSLTLIIILYYVQRNNMYKENYKEFGMETCKPYKTQLNIDYTRNQQMMKDDKYALTFNNKQYSSNQALAGTANPKTLKAPIVAPPIADLSHWRQNEFVNYPLINDYSQSDLYQSGYIPVDRCDTTTTPSSYQSPSPSSYQSPSPSSYQSPSPSTIETYSTNYAKEIDFMFEPKFLEDEKNIKEGYNLDGYIDKNLDTPPVGSSKKCIENNRGILMSDGYDRRNVQYNMPTNYGGGKCNLTKAMAEYNENIFTQTIQPDVYYKNQVIEPIQSNIGISFTQQFEPTDVSVTNGKSTYVSHDPFLYTPPVKAPEKQRATEYNVYDPRLSGYGTNYRAYIDKLSGQPRFYYDDVDSVRRPNYIVRSNVDHMPLAEKYGTMLNDREISNNTSQMRNHAQQNILDDTLAHRTDMQASLMRKRNSEMWQTRVAPLRRDSRRGC
jgi:hypothetical protein